MDQPPGSVERIRLEGGPCHGIEFLIAPGRSRLDIRPFFQRPDEPHTPRPLVYTSASRVDREGREVFVPAGE